MLNLGVNSSEREIRYIVLWVNFKYFPNAKSRNLPEYGRIPAFDLLAALDKMHYVNFY